MKIKHYQATVGCRIEQSLKEEADKILAFRNKSLSDFIREKILELVEEKENE